MKRESELASEKGTPRPWKPKQHEQGLFVAANGKPVLQVLSNGPVAEVLANIALVDAAINAHPELKERVECLEEALTSFASELTERVQERV